MATRRNIANAMNPDSPGVEGSLRDGAENQLARFPGKLPGQKGQAPDQLIHEIQVHHIELEMQAEELRRTHLELEESREKYLDLYEFAPLGYLTLSDEAVISRANLSAAMLLGIERSRLIDKRFRTLIVGEDLEIWDRYFINLLRGKKSHCHSHAQKGRQGCVSRPAGRNAVSRHHQWTLNTRGDQRYNGDPAGRAGPARE